MATSATPTLACPHCQTELRQPGQGFCTHCGLALRQPCPGCASELQTPAGGFSACPQCRTNFWACQDCGRLYHLDRTSCLNSYCPKRGEFWTARFGCDTWDSSRGHRSLPLQLTTDLDPIPRWLAGGGKERRFPSLHHSGLLISVQESGVVEMWAEHGAPRPGGGEGDEFREESVCLSRLDLGEPATGPPLLHRGQMVILGTNSVCPLDMTSNPSLGARLELPGTRGPLRALSMPEGILVAAPEGAWEVDLPARAVRQRWEGAISLALDPVGDGAGAILLAGAEPANPFWIYRQGGSVMPISTAFPTAAAPSVGGSQSLPEWSLYADRFLLFWRNQLAYLEGESLQVRELPAAVVGRPVYCPTLDRLILLLSDHTIRSCSTTGERFSFVCDMPGVPSTAPLRLGERVYYGSEGRYLCCDEEAMLPRLNSPPWGELSYANGRLFGTTKEGVLFAFSL